MPQLAGSPAPTSWSAARAALSVVARERARALGLPTTALEDWRYVALTALSRLQAAAPRAVSRDEIIPWTVPGTTSVVLVDGQLRAELSDPLPAGAPLILCEPGQLPEAQASALLRRWSDRLAGETDISACWALADGERGLAVQVQGAVVQPLHLISITSGGVCAATVTITMQANASVTVILTHVPLAPSRCSLALDLELAAGAQATVDELQVAPGSDTAQLFTVVRSQLGRDSRLRWTSVHRGCALGRSRLEALLGAPGASVELAALSLLRATSQWHDLTRIAHAVGPSTSQQLYKTIADDAALGSFDGLVSIRPGADLSEARQRHQSLLLSPKARIDSRPQLDIAADDVTASHGSSIGQLSADELFYLQSRGLPVAQARALLLGGFVQDIARRLSPPGQALLARHDLLPQHPAPATA